MDYKKISEMFTVAVPLLIICSCIRLITYYSHWNIPILDYLSVTELLFLFIRPAIICAALAAIYLAANAVFFGIIYGFVKLDELRRRGKKDAKATAHRPTDSEHKESKPMNRVAIIGTVLFIAFGIWLFFNAIWYEYSIYPTVVAHIVLWIGAIWVIKKLLNEDVDAPSIPSILAGSIIVLLSASFFIARYEINQTRTSPQRHRISLSDKSVIETDSNRLFLGRSSNYYFFYENAESRSSIIPASEVVRIEIQNP